MRRMLDSTCPRCGFRTSSEGLPEHVVRDLAAMHVCADGTPTIGGEPTERLVPGPGERNPIPKEEPQIVVDSDFDGYFERLVRNWVHRRMSMGPLKHREIRISSGPYRADAVTLVERDGGVLAIDFYSALRTGFGQLSDAEISAIIERL